jgi:hypothetical protein
MDKKITRRAIPGAARKMGLPLVEIGVVDLPFVIG